jgi:hypothetical protein
VKNKNRTANTGFMLLLRLGLFRRLVSYRFSFSKRFSFKVFGIFALVCDKISNRHKAWERYYSKMLPKSKTLLIIISLVFFLLLIPFLAMQFTNEVTWSVMDFVMAGILLLGTGLAIEYVLRKVKNTKHHIIICSLILLALLLLWLELAVGIFGTPIAGD